MTSLIMQRLASDAYSRSERAELRKQIAGLSPGPAPRFMAVWLGNSVKGDTEPDYSLTIMTDGDIVEVDPARVVFEAEIDQEAGACRIGRLPDGTMSLPMMQHFLAWLNKWYGEPS